MRGRWEIDNIAAIPKLGPDSLAPQRPSIQGFRQRGDLESARLAPAMALTKSVCWSRQTERLWNSVFAAMGAGFNERSPGPWMAAGCYEQDGGLRLMFCS